MREIPTNPESNINEMDDRDNGTRPNCASPDDEKRLHTSNDQAAAAVASKTATPTHGNDTDNDKHRYCVSLPLYYNQVRFPAFLVFSPILSE